MRLGAKTRDQILAENFDHIRLYLAAAPADSLPIYSIFVTPDGIIRDIKTIQIPSAVDSLPWNGASLINVRTTKEGYEGSLAVPWVAIGLKGPKDIVFNVRCGSARFSKKLVRNAYQEPFQKKPAACAVARMTKNK